MKPAVVLLDTSVLLELLNVPGRTERHAEVLAEFTDRIDQGQKLLMPVASILETGNLIAQVKDGTQRRAAAERFVKLLRLAIDGTHPFAPTGDLTEQELKPLVDHFVDDATVQLSLGDRSLLIDRDRQKRLHRDRPITLWTFDDQLAAHDTQDRP